MAIVWGSEYGEYAKLGFDVTTTDTSTKRTVSVDVWLWTKYAATDSSNVFYFDFLNSSGNATTSKGAVTIKTTVNSSWSESNKVKLGTYSKSYDRGTSASTKYISAALSGVDIVGVTIYASTTVSIPALPTYTIKYDANGGSGAPSSQTKTHGTALTLSSTEPTRTGYTFQGWSTSKTATSATYSAGGSYTSNAATTLYAVWKIITYTIKYDANGGSGAPSSQTKTHDTDLTLSTTKPTRTGYTFQGWSTSKTATSATYSSGATYTANAAATLYAVWKAVTYTIKYDANGGSNAPASQIKTHGVDLKLTSEKPTRSKHSFLGWSTSKTATTATYAAGGTYTADAGTTLYAVWSLTYVPPRIYKLKIERLSQNDSGEYTDTTGSAGPSGKKYSLADDGTYALVSFSWATDNVSPKITVSWTPSTGTSSAEVTKSGLTSGTENLIIGGSFNSETTYSITVNINDGGGDSSALGALASVKFPIDVLAGGTGVAFGKVAELEDNMDVNYQAVFRKPVSGKALGMDIVTRIMENEDLNDYLDPGCYAIYTNANAKTVNNVPVGYAGRLEVWSSCGNAIKAESYSYIRQCYYPYKMENGLKFERDIIRETSNVWTYGPWRRTGQVRHVLYSNSTGSTATIDLNATSTDFAYIEIFYTGNNSPGGYTKISAPTNGQKVYLSMTKVSSATQLTIYACEYTLSASALTPTTSTAGYTRLTNGSSVELSNNAKNYVYITKVVGYYE